MVIQIERLFLSPVCFAEGISWACSEVDGSLAASRSAAPSVPMLLCFILIPGWGSSSTDTKYKPNDSHAASTSQGKCWIWNLLMSGTIWSYRKGVVFWSPGVSCIIPFPTLTLKPQNQTVTEWYVLLTSWEERYVVRNLMPLKIAWVIGAIWLPFSTNKEIKIVVWTAIFTQNCWVTVLFFEQKKEMHMVGVRFISKKKLD